VNKHQVFLVFTYEKNVLSYFEESSSVGKLHVFENKVFRKYLRLIRIM
jgi:hypothetical protein